MIFHVGGIIELVIVDRQEVFLSSSLPIDIRPDLGDVRPFPGRNFIRIVDSEEVKLHVNRNWGNNLQ
jgi:hypothetical protein